MEFRASASDLKAIQGSESVDRRFCLRVSVSYSASTTLSLFQREKSGGREEGDRGMNQLQKSYKIQETD